MPRKFRRVLRKGYSQKKPVKSLPDENALACSDNEDSILDTIDASVQTGTAFSSLKSTATQTDISMHPDCYQLDATIQCNMDEELKEDLPPDSSINYIMCEGNKDGKFYPLIEKHKGIFKDSSG